MTPEQQAHVEKVIDEFNFPVTYFFNGFGFDPKDTLRRFAAEILKGSTDKGCDCQQGQCCPVCDPDTPE